MNSAPRCSRAVLCSLSLSPPSLPQPHPVSRPPFVLVSESVVYVGSSTPNATAPTFRGPRELPLQSWAQLLKSRHSPNVARFCLRVWSPAGSPAVLGMAFAAVSPVAQSPGKGPARRSGAVFLLCHVVWDRLSLFVLDDIGVPENNG